MLNLLKRIKKMIGGTSNSSELEYRINHGFVHGKNFNCYNISGIDANYPWLISVGDDVTIASNVNILAHDASTNHVGCHVKIGRVIIGNNVFIGNSAIILPNVKIGDNVIIGAGSVVSKSIPDNSVFAGNPAKFIMSFDDYKSKHEKNLSVCHYFNEHSWYEWGNADQEEHDYMIEVLGDDIGYV